jgi:hypothetical protein
MTCEAQASSKMYTLAGLNLVDGTSVVADLVADLQHETTLLVLGPYEDLYLSLYRRGQSMYYWVTTEQLTYKELSAMPQQRQTLAYPGDHQEQYMAVRRLMLDTFFTLATEQKSSPEELQIPADSTPLVTVREINSALRAHSEHTGGKVYCLNQQRDRVIRVFHAKQPRGDSIKVAGSDGHWITPAAIWVEQMQ